jgi:hypothetical protein
MTAPPRITVQLRSLGLLGLLGLLPGCGDTGQPLVDVPVAVVGTEARAVKLGAVEVKLDKVTVGFGPVRLCASRFASDELCPAALAEWADSFGGLDLLSTSPRIVGTVHGFAGTTRSVSYDWAYTWLPTQSDPQPTSRAVAGHSAHLEGTVTWTSSKTTMHFVADVDVVPSERGTHGASQTLPDSSVGTSTGGLEITFDPNLWLEQVDFDELADKGEEPARILPGSRAHTALVVAMTSLAPPRFAWTVGK